MARLRQWLPLKPTGLTRFMGALQLYYLYEIFASNDTGGFSFTWESLALVLWSVLTITTFFKVLANAFYYRWVIIIANVWFIMMFATASAYQFGAKDALQWHAIIENVGIAFSPESVNVIWHMLDTRSLVYGLIICAVFLVLEWRYGTISQHRHNPHHWKKKGGGLLICGLLITLPIIAWDPLLNFHKSVYYHYRNSHNITVTIPDNTYPFLRSLSPTNRQASDIFIATNTKATRPTIFLIIVESLNASVIDKVSPDGRPYTPFLNKLKHSSVFVQTFYGNSIQTAKGHFAILNSFTPSTSGKTFVKHPSITLPSIASELKDIGYSTHTFAAHKNRDFDNTAHFLLTHGYDDYTVADDYLQETDKINSLKWSVKDSVFLRRFFDYYDAVHTDSAPEFYTILTVANHFPFNSMSDADKQVYPSPTSIQEDYANSVRLVDDGLRVFFEELKARGQFKNSVIIVTGDHAFPLGKHGNYHLEAGYHDDSFRVPLFITWPNGLTPTIISTAHSQLDIAPTILDLLSVSRPTTHMMGQSIFNPSPNHSFPLIQPYAKHFSIIKYPYKYRYSQKNDTTYLYHLINDPMEAHPISPDSADWPHDLTPIFTQGLTDIYKAEYSIKQNRVWPPSQDRAKH